QAAAASDQTHGQLEDHLVVARFLHLHRVGVNLVSPHDGVAVEIGGENGGRLAGSRLPAGEKDEVVGLVGGEIEYGLELGNVAFDLALKVAAAGRHRQVRPDQGLE